MIILYANNGNSWRLAESDWDISPGEVSFDHEPSEAELIAAFPDRLAAKKMAKWEEVKAERDRRKFDGGAKVGGYWFLTTLVAVAEYSTLALMSIGLPSDTLLRQGWRTMSGATVPMTVDLVAQIQHSGFTQWAAIDDAAQAHKAALEASDDPSAYDYLSNWPLIYSEYNPE